MKKIITKKASMIWILLIVSTGFFMNQLDYAVIMESPSEIPMERPINYDNYNLHEVKSANPIDNVIPVPYKAHDPTIPHPTYGGRVTRFKAIARGSSTTVFYRWDIDGDGTWDADSGRTAVRPGNWYQANQYNIEFDHIFSPQTNYKLYNAIVEVASSVDGSGVGSDSKYGTYRILIYPNITGVMDADTVSDEELNLLADIALGENLWMQHKQLIRSGSGTATIMGYLSFDADTSKNVALSSMFLLSLEEAGYMAAYPTGTYSTYSKTILNPEFESLNAMLWAVSPYAEDAIRITNYLLNQLSSVSVTTTDEGDDGNTPITGTNDQIGYYIQANNYDWNNQPFALAALGASWLMGTVAQVGTLAQGNYMEFIIQQMVDYACYAQIESGQSLGGWGANPSATSADAYMTGGWIYALKLVDIALSSHNVIVNNRIRFRIANVVRELQNSNHGAGYTIGSTSSMETTGLIFMGATFLGWESFSLGDGTSAGYSPYVTMTRGEARLIFDNYYTYLVANWTQTGTGTSVVSFIPFWSNGNYNTTAGQNTFIYGLFGLEAASLPMINMFGMHDLSHDLRVNLVKKQDTEGYFDITSYWYRSSLGDLGYSSLGGLILADMLIYNDPSPVAIGDLSATTVYEGISGLSKGYITFDQSDSFHPSPTRQIVEYQWIFDVNPNDPQSDFDAIDWGSLSSGSSTIYGTPIWKGSDPDAYPTMQYMLAGTYFAALRVIDDNSMPKTDVFLSSQITVLEGTEPTYQVNSVNGSFFNTNPEIDVDFQDNINLDRIWFNIDEGDWIEIANSISGATYTANFTLGTEWNSLSEGSHNVNFKAQDDQGFVNQSLTNGWQFYKDTTAPTLVINSPLAQEYLVAEITLDFVGAEEYWYYIEGQDSTNQTWSEENTRILQDGTYIIHVYGNDSAGNENSTTLTFSINTAGPQISILTPSITDSADVSIELTGTAVSYWYYIEGIDTSNMTYTESTTRVIPDGSYILHAYGEDAGGNVVEVTQSLKVDTTAPVLLQPINSINLTEGTPLDLIINATDLTLPLTFVVDSEDFQIDNEGRLINSTSLVVGTYSVNVSISDDLGNVLEFTILITINSDTQDNGGNQGDPDSPSPSIPGFSPTLIFGTLIGVAIFLVKQRK